jgi:hypothetical protein
MLMGFGFRKVGYNQAILQSKCCFMYKEYLTDELLVEEVGSIEIDGLPVLLFLLVTPVVLNHGVATLLCVAGFFWRVAIS